ncbi:MAG: response regulator transcription factor [Clostridiales bacterium]|nr:response regulator transcription factor [Clostridiales bacterium]
MVNNIILVCDDDRDIVRAISIYLENEGYKVIKAYNGREAVECVKKYRGIKLAILDIMMPVMDGYEACHEIRKDSNIPIIFLTAKSQDSDKITGLDIGADDYITKPFNSSMLVARVKSALRRYTELGSGNNVSEHIVGGIILNETTKKVTVDGEEVVLTPTEYGILKVLMEQPGRVLSAKDIYRAVWEGDPIGAEGTIAVHIRHIREKIEIDPANPRYIKVLWGQGYKLEEN